MTSHEFLSRLHGVKKNRDGWEACCPTHDDRAASLSVSTGDDGRILLHCHAGCSVESIVATLGLTLADLFPLRSKGKHDSKPRIAATYVYRDETGNLHFQTVRHGTRFDDLRRKCARFIADHTEAIRSATPAIPDALNDRAADNWTRLLALGDLAGGEWPAIARQVALELSGDEEAEALGTNAQLLADIRHVFGEGKTDRIASKDLCERLAEMEGRPWAEFGKSPRPISPNQLANLLRAFRITSRGVRIGESTPKGYLLDDFDDAFSCYLPGNDDLKRNSATKPVNIDENSLFQNATPEPCCTSEKATLANNDAGCGVVALPNAPAGIQRQELVEEVV